MLKDILKYCCGKQKPCCVMPVTEKDREFLITMAKALGNPVRLAILEFLITHPGCIVADIVNVVPIAQSTTSQHLKVLQESGWIIESEEGASTSLCLNKVARKRFADLINILCST